MTEQANASGGERPSPGFNKLPIFILGTIFLVIGLVFGGKACQDAQQRELLEQGKPASAKIVKLTDTGNRLNRDPVYVLTLVVTPPEGEAWQAEVEKVLNVVDAQTYVVGALLDVKYDAGDPSRVAIVGPAKAATAPAPAPAAPAPAAP